MRPMKRIALSLLLLTVTALAGCKAKKTYPDPDPGWHSPDYGIIFGRLQRIAAKDPDSAPIWLVRYDFNQDRYRGELALTPAEKLVGYSGGEMVEIHGAVKTAAALGSYPGTWYEVHSIQLWASYSGR